VETEQDLLPEARYGPEVEREATAPPRSIAAALIGGGVLGLVMSVQQPELSLRERLIAAGGSLASVGLGALALSGPLSLTGPARRAPASFAVACYGSAAVSTAFGGGHKTPAYFPAIVLTALGGGVGGNLATGRRGGGAVAAAYLGGAALTMQPWRNNLDREDWWIPAGALGFLGSGIVGAIAGDLNLKMRALTDFAEREGETAGREVMESVSEKVREQGAHFLELVSEVDKVFEDLPDVSTATADLATALSSLHTVRTMPLQTKQVSLGAWPRLRAIAEDYNKGDGNVRVSLQTTTNAPPSPNGATTDALCECATALLQNAANARTAGGPPVQATVTLELRKDPAGDRRRLIRMTVEDDAGGSPVPASAWGGGLSASQATAQDLGGDLSLELGQTGLRAIFEVPYVSNRDPGERPTTFVREAASGRDACLRALRRVTAAQAVAIAFSVSEREALPRRLVAIAALFAGGELVQRLSDERQRALAAAPLAVVAMSAFPGSGRPPLGGWSCVMCAQTASSGSPPLGWVAAALGTMGATAVAGPERFSGALETTLGDRTFPLIGAVVGANVWRGLRGIEDQEERVADEAWRRQALADLAAPLRQRHHLLKPVKEAMDVERWQELDKSELGSEVKSQERSLQEAQAELENLLTEGSPLRELQHQLARMLAPAPVRLLGEWPVRTVPEQGRELEAVRYRLALIGLGQAIALRVRDYLPTSLLLPEPLQELQVHVEPLDETGDREHTRFTIVQVPFKALRHDRADAIIADASRRAGGDSGRRIGNSFEVSVHNTALR
jgi:hypothetical protein